jgi:hypothetical protein
MLDQGQTITIDAAPQVYNLTQFDGYKTERIGTLTSGDATKLRIDHTDGKKTANSRHLHQYQEDLVDDVSGATSPLTVNVTISHPHYADKTRIAAVVAGFVTWLNANLARTLNFES